MNVRFLQRMGASTPEAVAAGAVDDVSEKVVKAVLVLATLPFVSVDIDTSRFASGGTDARLIGAIAVALAIGVAVTFAVPSLRAKALPRLRVALDSLAGVARVRRKRLELFGGNLLSELLFALVLGAACRAYGVELSLVELVFVNTAAGVLSSLIPVPGGIGAAEASTARTEHHQVRRALKSLMRSAASRFTPAPSARRTASSLASRLPGRRSARTLTCRCSTSTRATSTSAAPVRTA